MTTILAVANLGGHLRQLLELLPRLDVQGDVLWMTNDGEQSRSLLADQTVCYLPYPRAGSIGDAVSNARIAARALRGRSVDVAVSTGSSLAVSVLPLAAARGAEVHYIESATRTAGPSRAGQLLQRLPAVHLYTQSTDWADHRWRYVGDVFDGFTLRPRATGGIRRVVVTLGTSTFGGFRRLCERLLTILPADVEVLWQTGTTDVTGLPIEPTVELPATALEAAIVAADVVVSHAGTGSALTALANGKAPVLVPRDPLHGEHVDGHQFEIAERLAAAGLGIVRRVEELTLDTLTEAASFEAVRLGDTRPFPLT
ncbi:glycosyltransferase [Egicoccus halophilus]|uniref:Glycosyl transferase n=1 Tax=Egicoccus halophilus TaxID=1670830 RepID=A0A8J3A9J9_9ACTN|nr:glycosyltransferase [Egicoccus halophilus]GGI05296.1 glycosyl transferase [Egicoccus halophilus]